MYFEKEAIRDAGTQSNYTRSRVWYSSVAD